MKRLKTMSLLLAGALAGLFPACTQDDDPMSGTKGKVNVLLTDAPFPADQVAEANVVIDRIEIRKGGSEDSVQFYVISDEQQEFNLLDLRNGVTAHIGDADLEPGVYDQLRLHVVESNIVLNDEANTVFDMKIPSGSSSGLKINITNGLEVTGGSTSTLILDFDVSKSFVVQGNPNTPAGIKGFIFKPVIRATVKDIAGSIEGTVIDSTAKTPLVNVPVEVLQDTLVISSALTNEQGYYAVIGLLPGNYWVRANAEGYQEFEATDVAVKEQEKTVVNISMVPVPAAPAATTTTTTGE